ncbi:MAG: hypothetical protein II912_05395 [Clostridia bacterium]|jgi:hypothetical protein|nr:hypothetical protein [Clostridia bacterium]MBR5380198.1 hypothetical protein [Clostridia bacterium]
MFNNVGSKCKTLAKVLCWIGIAFSIIWGIVMMAASALRVQGSGSGIMVLYGLLVMILGSLASWLSSLSLYAIGEAAENSAIAANLAIKADKEREEAKRDM